jgi:hypothetical protein
LTDSEGNEREHVESVTFEEIVKFTLMKTGQVPAALLMREFAKRIQDSYPNLEKHLTAVLDEANEVAQQAYTEAQENVSRIQLLNQGDN